MTVIETIDSARKILKDVIDTSRTFPDNSSGFNTDSEMLDWYNWAQVEVQTLLGQTHEHYFVTSTSISLVANTEEYSMPCGVLNIVRVEDVTSPNSPVEIIPISFNDKEVYEGVNIDPSGVSDVLYYAIKGNSLVFRPRPAVSNSSGIKVYYSRIVATLISATDCSVIPAAYHELIMWGVVENGLIKQEATAEAIASVLGRRNRLIKQMMDSAQNRQVQRSRSVRRVKRG